MIGNDYKQELGTYIVQTKSISQAISFNEQFTRCTRYTNTVFEKATLGNRNWSFLDLCDDGYMKIQRFLFKPGGNCGPR